VLAFSKNWNGPLATEVTAHLMSRLQGDTHLCDLLNRMNFEDALFQLQTEFLLLGKSKYPPQEARLATFQSALSDVFDRMNSQFQSRQFDFSSDVARKVAKFLTGFDAIFTLNQDLLSNYITATTTLPFGMARDGKVGKCPACAPYL
jgi:hypothetical protein